MHACIHDDDDHSILVEAVSKYCIPGCNVTQVQDPRKLELISQESKKFGFLVPHFSLIRLLVMAVGPQKHSPTLSEAFEVCIMFTIFFCHRLHLTPGIGQCALFPTLPLNLSLLVSQVLTRTLKSRTTWTWLVKTISSSVEIVSRKNPNRNISTNGRETSS